MLSETMLLVRGSLTPANTTVSQINEGAKQLDLEVTKKTIMIGVNQ